MQVCTLHHRSIQLISYCPHALSSLNLFQGQDAFRYSHDLVYRPDYSGNQKQSLWRLCFIRNTVSTHTLLSSPMISKCLYFHNNWHTGYATQPDLRSNELPSIWWWYNKQGVCCFKYTKLVKAMTVSSKDL